MIQFGIWVLTACIDGNIICIRDTPPPKLVHYEPEKSCYIDGIFYPRCADYDNPEVQHYHKMFYK
jgi:hypothetical protein